MSKRCKYVLYMIVFVIVCALSLLLIKVLFFSGIFTPMMKLKGERVMEVALQSNFVDPGVKTRYHLSDFNNEVQVKGHVDTNTLGTYTLSYEAKSHNKKVKRTVHVVDKKAPVITLKGNRVQRIFVNGAYEEAGFVASDNCDGDITSRVKIEHKVNTKKVGTYTITYRVKDQSGNETSVQRKVQVCKDPTSTTLHYDYDSYDNTAEEWWFHKSKDHKRMDASKDKDMLKKYDTYYLGPDEKVIYLTFDEGGNDITYIKEIADVLKKNDVTATYFLTRNYIKNNPEFMNQLVDDGNVIGNHTWHHYDMTTLANASGVDTFVKEITETEKTYMEVTGKAMKKVFRFPKGGESERAMKMVSDLGYSTFTWSHAYYDYGGDVSKQEALDTLMKHYHNGAIYLLHPSNKGNYDAMDSFIKNMKDLGYRFETVDKIPKEVKKNINK